MPRQNIVALCLFSFNLNDLLLYLHSLLMRYQFVSYMFLLLINGMNMLLPVIKEVEKENDKMFSWAVGCKSQMFQLQIDLGVFVGHILYKI